MVRLVTVYNPIEASLLTQQLQNAGVACFITNANSTSLLPHFAGLLGHGIQVMVADDDYSRAKEIINKNEEQKVTVRPYCGSSNLGFGIKGRTKTRKLIAIMLSFLFEFPFGNIKNRYYCLDCDGDFSSERHQVT